MAHLENVQKGSFYKKYNKKKQRDARFSRKADIITAVHAYACINSNYRSHVSINYMVNNTINLQGYFDTI